MDSLAGAAWFCASTAPGAAEHPGELEVTEADWYPATVPGTVAGALREAGSWSWGTDDEALLDGRDWWFRSRFSGTGTGAAIAGWELQLDGIATLADVWLNGEHLSHGENMFVAQRIAVDLLEHDNELVIRCAALLPRLDERHPRPRFKSRLVRHQSLRWYRTALLGRMPGWSRWAAPVGPWRPVRLVTCPVAGMLSELTLRTTCEESGGEIVIAFALRRAAELPRQIWMEADGQRVALQISNGAAGIRVSGRLTLERAERWWPHTHGAQPLYPVVVEIDGDRRTLRSVGFRELEIERDGGAFEIRINGVRCFCRGVTWGPVDPVSLAPADEELRRMLDLVRAADINMIRVGGFGLYEDSRFWDRCDELGILVWQDCMLASIDPPDDPRFIESLSAELVQQFGALQGRPSLTVACGSSETYQQGSLYGLAPERYESEVLERVIPEILAPVIPEIPYLPSSPSGGNPPIRPDTGVAHYFGVGAYLRPLSDARLADVRFAAECLSFANPPERATVQRVYGSAAAAGHDPRWKLAVARDAGTSWDFEDVRDHYVRELFGLDPLAERYADPEHALDLGRAATVEIMSGVLTDWRSTGSRCAGALVLAWGDLWPGAGWGVTDADGLPKAAYYALARAFAPCAVHIRDRGLSGLAVDVFNDGPAGLAATLRISIRNPTGVELDAAERVVELEPHHEASFDSAELLGGFRDLTAAYRFSPPEYDVVVATLVATDGTLLGRAYHLPAGCARPRQDDVGLRAHVVPTGVGRWSLSVSAMRFAQFVSIDAPGFVASDSWFHIATGETVELELRGSPARAPCGMLRALNSVTPSHITGGK